MTGLPSLANVKRILIVKTSSIGDVIHALPVIQAIKEARPDLTLGWVVRRRCADVLRGNPWIDTLHVAADKPSWSELVCLRQAMRAEHYDAALDMQGLLLSGLITWLSGAPLRVGWDRNREGNAFWLTDPVVPGRVSDKRGDTHEVSALYGFAALFGVAAPPSEFTPQPYLALEGRKEAADWLQGLPYPRIALNVGASRAYKRWPVAYWAQLADRLAEQGRGLVFIGDERDSAMVAQVQAHRARSENDLDLSGKTNLRQLAAVLAACDLVISGDTGPMHIAVAVGTPVIALFGATNPARHGPYGGRNIVLRPPGAALTGRRPTDAEGESAMRAISPDAVLQAVAGRVKL
jgi:heptosyltransferase-1